MLFARVEDAKHETLTDETPIPASSAAGIYPWLVCVGSPEDGFKDAGTIIDLSGVRAVRFGRGSGGELRVERSNNVLRLRIPLGWVSSVHAELRVSASSLRYEFELRDLGSRNGTHVDREIIDGPRPVRSGQVFEIGRSFWVLRAASSRFEHSQSLPGELSSVNPNTWEMTRRLERLARSNIPLLFAGETGTGKEHHARLVHAMSERRGPFLKINLSALPEHRFDETIFGGEGIFGRAHNGTLFLDEIDALDPAQQAKLNTALTNTHGLERRTGLPARIVSATHRDLHKLVSSHEFRGDLYSKISGYLARIPPLRDRREDLGILCRALLKNEETRAQGQLVTRAFRRLLQHSWPFNIRELRQTLTTAVVLSSAGGSITMDMVEEILNRRQDLPRTPDSIEKLRRELVRGLITHRGDLGLVARESGREMAEVIRLVERFGLKTESFDDAQIEQTIVDPG